MDGQRFDHITKRVSGSRSRRQALMAFGGAVIAGTLGAFTKGSEALAANCPNCIGAARKQ